MPNRIADHDPIGYRDAGGAWHQLIVSATVDGTFEVIDVCDDQRHLVDTLAGYGDGPVQALAVASAYAAQHHHP